MVFDVNQDFEDGWMLIQQSSWYGTAEDRGDARGKKKSKSVKKRSLKKRGKMK